MEVKHLEQLLNRALIEYEELQNEVAEAVKILEEVLNEDVADNTNAIEEAIKILKGVQ